MENLGKGLFFNKHLTKFPSNHVGGLQVLSLWYALPTSHLTSEAPNCVHLEVQPSCSNGHHPLGCPLSLGILCLQKPRESGLGTSTGVL